MIDPDDVKRMDSVQRQEYIHGVAAQGEKAAESDLPMSACPFPMCRDERLWWKTGYESVPG